MESVKFVTVSNHTYYKNCGSIKKLFNYIMKDKETGNTVRYFGSPYVGIATCDMAVNQIKAIKKYYKKTNGRQMYHYVLSFPSVIKDAKKVSEIAMEIALRYFNDYQTIFAVHENTDNLHIHFIFNSVSFATGNKWNMNHRDFYCLKHNIEEYANMCLYSNDLSILF